MGLYFNLPQKATIIWKTNFLFMTSKTLIIHLSDPLFFKSYIWDYLWYFHFKKATMFTYSRTKWELMSDCIPDRSHKRILWTIEVYILFWYLWLQSKSVPKLFQFNLEYLSNITHFSFILYRVATKKRNGVGLLAIIEKHADYIMG